MPSNHGHAIAPNKRSKTYESWQMMKYRCHTETSPDYPNYGALGIKVCERWRESFIAFLNDMGMRPEGLTLDRIDVNGDYTPENCQWASRKQQARNRKQAKQKIRSNTGFLGVTAYSATNFRARFGTKLLCGFTSAEDAATAYNFLAFEAFGVNARYNTVPQPWLEEFV